MALFFTVWIHFCSALLAHPVNVSVTNMDVDAQKRSIELSIKMFTHDLETILHNKYNVDGWIGTPAEHGDGRRLLVEYIGERFSVSVNDGEKISLSADSTAIADESMLFYMTGQANQSIRRVEISNRLLTDFFSNQTNLVIISDGRRDFGYKLNRETHKIELSIGL